MADKPRDYNEDLATIMNAMAESTLDMTDEEIECEIREEGDDPNAVAERVRDVLREAVNACRQRILLESQKQYDERIATLRTKKYKMPGLPEERREMISTLLAANPALGYGLLTAQFRDFKNLPDEDIEIYLGQLLELIETNDLIDSEQGDK